MSPTWYGNAAPPAARRAGVAGWLRVALRGLALLVLFVAGYLLLLCCRLVEHVFGRGRRPASSHVVVLVCRTALRIIGLRLRHRGRVALQSDAVVANHSSWLDILVLNATRRVHFVSKDEVAGWPVIGLLARSAGTVFIERARARAADQALLFRARLRAGDRLLFFPEGTSSDGLRVLPFKSTLFAAFFDDALRERARLQPVALRYHAPAGEDPRFYGWWGDMDLVPHLLAVLGAARQGRVDVVFAPVLRVSDQANRKALAAAAEAAIREAHREAGAAAADQGW